MTAGLATTLARRSPWYGRAPRDIPQNSIKRRLRNLLLDRNLYLDTANITESKLQAFQPDAKTFPTKNHWLMLVVSG